MHGSKHNETTTTTLVHPDSLRAFQGYQKCDGGDNGEVNMFGGRSQLEKTKQTTFLNRKNALKNLYIITSKKEKKV
jgi:hypothetical protein